MFRYFAVCYHTASLDLIYLFPLIIVDMLEYFLGFQSDLVAHFSYLRENVHRPVTNFMSSLSKFLIGPVGQIGTCIEFRKDLIQEIEVWGRVLFRQFRQVNCMFAALGMRSSAVEEYDDISAEE